MKIGGMLLKFLLRAHSLGSVIYIVTIFLSKYVYLYESIQAGPIVYSLREGRNGLEFGDRFAFYDFQRS